MQDKITRCQFNPVSQGWDCAQVSSYEVLVRSDDIDGLGHTNNRCYVDWCEAAAWAHSVKLGLGLAEYRQLDRAMAVRHAEYDYIASTYEGERLLVGTWLSEMSAVQMRRYFQIVRPHDGSMVACAAWHLVCIELSTGKAKRLPTEFVSVYGAVELPSPGK